MDKEISASYFKGKSLTIVFNLEIHNKVQKREKEAVLIIFLEAGMERPRPNRQVVLES